MTDVAGLEKGAVLDASAGGLEGLRTVVCRSRFEP